MGNSSSVYAHGAVGRQWMTHAQALIDCYPESQLSAAEKEHCYRVLEDHPYWAWMVLNGSSDAVRKFVCGVIAKFPLIRPDATHHYRGFAEMPPPTVAQALAPDAAPPASPSAQANAVAPPQSEEGPAEEERADPAEASSSAATVASRSTDAGDDETVVEERVPLITKKTQ